MADLTISALAQTTGVPSSALRYYERIGLLRPLGRTPAGYRVYDDRAIERLAFINRAKHMGLPLDEIGELMELWDDGPCAPVQTRLRELVDEKVASLHIQISELHRFQTQLAHVQRALASTEAADRCGPGCPCGAEVPVDALEPAEIACVLGAEEVPARLDAWERMLQHVQQREPIAHGMRLRLPGDPEILSGVAALIAREVECCTFFTFSLSMAAGVAWLDIAAPPEAQPLVAALFG